MEMINRLKKQTMVGIFSKKYNLNCNHELCMIIITLYLLVIGSLKP